MFNVSAVIAYGIYDMLEWSVGVEEERKLRKENIRDESDNFTSHIILFIFRFSFFIFHFSFFIFRF